MHTAHSLDSGFDDLGYGFAPTSNASAPHIREIALWCAVIEQACIDVGVIKPFATKRPMSARGPEYRDAERWLTRDKGDFFLVCGLAGINPDVIRMSARKAGR